MGRALFLEYEMVLSRGIRECVASDESLSFARQVIYSSYSVSGLLESAPGESINLSGSENYPSPDLPITGHKIRLNSYIRGFGRMLSA